MSLKKYPVMDDLFQLSKRCDEIIEEAITNIGFDDSVFEAAKKVINRILGSRGGKFNISFCNSKSSNMRPKPECYLEPFPEIRSHVHKKTSSKSLEDNFCTTFLNSDEKPVTFNKTEVHQTFAFENDVRRKENISEKLITPGNTSDELRQQPKLDTERCSKAIFEKFSTPYNSKIRKSTHHEKVCLGKSSELSPISDESTAKPLQEETILISSGDDKSVCDPQGIFCEDCKIRSDMRNVKTRPAFYDEVKATPGMLLNNQADSSVNVFDKTYTLSSDSNKENTCSTSLSSSSEERKYSSHSSGCSNSESDKYKNVPIIPKTKEKGIKKLPAKLYEGRFKRRSVLVGGYASHFRTLSAPVNRKVTTCRNLRPKTPTDFITSNRQSLKVRAEEKRKQREIRVQRTKERRECLEREREERILLREHKLKKRFEQHEEMLKQKIEKFKIKSRSRQRCYSKKSDASTPSKDSKEDRTKENDDFFRNSVNSGDKLSKESNGYHDVTLGKSDLISLDGKVGLNPTISKRENAILEGCEQTPVEFPVSCDNAKLKELSTTQKSKKLKEFEESNSERDESYTRTIVLKLLKQYTQDRSFNSKNNSVKTLNANTKNNSKQCNIINRKTLRTKRTKHVLVPSEQLSISDCSKRTPKTYSLRSAEKLKERKITGTSALPLKEADRFKDFCTENTSNDSKESDSIKTLNSETEENVKQSNKIKCKTSRTKRTKHILVDSRQMSRSDNSKLIQNTYLLRSAEKVNKLKVTDISALSLNKADRFHHESPGQKYVNVEDCKTIRISSEGDKMCSKFCFKMTTCKSKHISKVPKMYQSCGNSGFDDSLMQKKRKRYLHDSTETINKGRPNRDLENKQEITSYEIPDDASENSEESIVDPEKIPLWATGVYLKQALIRQYFQPPKEEEIFGVLPQEAVDLTVLFGKDRSEYHRRTSSENWSLNKTPV